MKNLPVVKIVVSWLLLLMASHLMAAPTNVELLAQMTRQYVDERRPGAAKSDRADYSTAAFEAEIEQQQSDLQKLLGIEPEGLSLEQDIDRRLLIGIARSDINTACPGRLRGCEGSQITERAHRVLKP